MTNTDREARLEVIRERMSRLGCTREDCKMCNEKRFLLSEIDRLRARLSELEYAARSYVQSGAVNERDRLKAKLEGEDEQD